MQTNIKFLLVFILFIKTPLLFAQSNDGDFVVVLDAGHGGKDPGRPTKFEKEKNVALNIVLSLGKALEKENNISVIYTRKTDVYVDLHKRGAIANKADADLFISIHCNAHETQAIGTETWVLGTKRGATNFNVAKAENEVILLEDNYEKHYEGYDPNSPESIIGLMLMNEDYLEQSILFATYVQQNFEKELKRKNRGVKHEGFIVLHQTYMPSVLIETGFLTNKKEGKYLSTKKGQAEISNAIKNAVLRYKSNLNDSFKQEDSITLNSDDNIDNNSIYSDIVFKVQIAASSKKLAAKPYNFKKLSEISREKVGRIYKYYYGETSDYTRIKSMKEEAYGKGYKSSFIVAYKDGKKIPLAQALKTSPN